jgi:hypothetical protein
MNLTPSLDDVLEIVSTQLRQQLAGVIAQRDQLADEVVRLRDQNARLMGRIFALSQDDSQLCHQHDMRPIPAAISDPQDDH